MQQPTDSKYRMCLLEGRTHKSVVGCTTLAPSDYTNRHNKVAGYIHWTICKHMGLQVHEEYYGHIPESDMLAVPLLCGCTGYHRSNNTSNLT